ncbi:cofactor assembly of complex C subunit B [Synechococcus sp. A10-1-5-1]|uniref:cofactor assembly of complex C subunit B n=1 Tax=Synechococcus sp. A10-1-5-1 TaxID=2936507 RepID=UPI002000D33A|nr:cofactor assembly of complex C subunit B [Synechococcus sp. A10-1-5-1]UPM50507.1 cofactor assembly of complex C subunit B [Synechococcus sp. A10-1-5-1]
MPLPARLCLVIGVLGLLLSVGNQLTAPELSPALERAAVLSSLLSVGLMLVSILWTRAAPLAPERVALDGEEGLELAADLPEPLRQELGWGSQMLLTATPAASLLLLWRGQVLLRRGVLADSRFQPGPICTRAWTTQKAINLVNLALYPGRNEFEGLPTNTPAVIVQPIAQDGLLLVAGWSPRCFTRSDESWIEGWSQKLRMQLERELVSSPLHPGPSEEA